MRAVRVAQPVRRYSLVDAGITCRALDHAVNGTLGQVGRLFGWRRRHRWHRCHGNDKSDRLLVTTSVVALLAIVSIALAQAPKGEQGQKEMSPPAVKEGAPADKAAPKTGETKEAPDKKKATKETTKEAPKAVTKEEKMEAPDKKATKEGTKDAPKEATKEPGKDGKADAKGSAGAVNLTQEQRTRVQTSFAKHKVQPANVNISINVGVAVPRTVELYAIPEEIIVIVPGYRRYRYFVIGERICIVDPDTYEIVEIIVIS